MLTFGITIPNFIVIFGIRIFFVLKQSELTRDFHPLDNVHAEHTKTGGYGVLAVASCC